MLALQSGIPLNLSSFLDDLTTYRQTRTQLVPNLVVPLHPQKSAAL